MHRHGAEVLVWERHQARNEYPYFDPRQSVVVDKGNLTKEVRRISGSTYETHHQNYVQLSTLGMSLGTLWYANVYPTDWVTVSNKYGSTFRDTN